MSSIDQAFIKAFARRPKADPATDKADAKQAKDANWLEADEEQMTRADAQDVNTVPTPHIPSKIVSAAHFRSDFVIGTVDDEIQFEKSSENKPVHAEPSHVLHDAHGVPAPASSQKKALLRKQKGDEPTPADAGESDEAELKAGETQAQPEPAIETDEITSPEAAANADVTDSSAVTESPLDSEVASKTEIQTDSIATPATEPELDHDEIADSIVSSTESLIQEIDAAIEEQRCATEIARTTPQVDDGPPAVANEEPKVATPTTIETSTETTKLAEDVDQPESPDTDPEAKIAESPAVQQDETPDNAFEPAWEVDEFDIPETVSDLFFKDDLFSEIANRMNEAVDDGLKSLIVTSVNEGEGRSSTALGIAIAAGSTGKRVALVDGDTDKPTLQLDLRLDLDYGWARALRSNRSLEQVAVHSINDNVTLIPILESDSDDGQQVSAGEVARLFAELENKFDLIVIDGPVTSKPRIHQFASLADTAIIVRDQAKTDTETLNEIAYRLQESGVRGVGLVENFSS